MIRDRKQLRNQILALCILSFGMISYECVGQDTKDQAKVVPQQLTNMVQCLVAADFVQQYALKYLDLKAGDWAWVRYYHGSVPGMSVTPDEYYVAVYSEDEKYGVLLLALPNDRKGYEAVSNIYQLTKQGSRWTADEGNGGYSVYEKMGRFVTKLANAPRYRIQLVPGDSVCTED